MSTTQVKRERDEADAPVDPDVAPKKVRLEDEDPPTSKDGIRIGTMPTRKFTLSTIVGIIRMGVSRLEKQPNYAPTVTRSVTEEGFDHFKINGVAPQSSVNKSQDPIQLPELPHFLRLTAKLSESKSLSKFMAVVDHDFSELPVEIRAHIDSMMTMIVEKIKGTQPFTATVNFSPAPNLEDWYTQLVESHKRTFLTYCSAFIAAKEPLVREIIYSYILTNTRDPACANYFDAKNPLVNDGVRHVMLAFDPNKESTQHDCAVVAAALYLIEFRMLASLNQITAMLTGNAVLCDASRTELCSQDSPERVVTDATGLYLRMCGLLAGTDGDMSGFGADWLEQELSTGVDWRTIKLVGTLEHAESSSKVTACLDIDGNGRFAAAEKYELKRRKKLSDAEAKAKSDPYADTVNMIVQISQSDMKTLIAIGKKFTKAGTPNQANIRDFVNLVRKEGAEIAPMLSSIIEHSFLSLLFGCNEYVMSRPVTHNFLQSLVLLAVLNDPAYDKEKKKKPVVGCIITDAKVGSVLPKNGFYLGIKPECKTEEDVKRYEWVDKLLDTADKDNLSNYCRPFHIDTAQKGGVCATSILSFMARPTVATVSSMMANLVADSREAGAKGARFREKRVQFKIWSNAILAFGSAGHDVQQRHDEASIQGNYDLLE